MEVGWSCGANKHDARVSLLGGPREWNGLLGWEVLIFAV